MLDRLSIQIGKASAWLTLFMVLVTFVIVVMRYVFDAGLIWLQESVVWMHAFVFMVGAAYTLQAAPGSICSALSSFSCHCACSSASRPGILSPSRGDSRRRPASRAVCRTP